MSPPEEVHPRLSLPLTAEGYAAANEAFRRCWSADRAEVLSFLRAHPPSIEAEGLNVLGVGVGDGSFDLQLIDTLHSLVGDVPLSYVAVEPNEAQLDGFRSRVSGAPKRNTQFTFLALRAEDYVPERRFELIHYIHSLYHMPGGEERLLRMSLENLRPGGRLLIALSSERGGIYQLMQRFWNEIDYSFFTGGLFGQESLRELFERNAIPYRYELYPHVSIDVSACFEPKSELGRNLLNFLLQADMQRAPESLRQRVLDALAELSHVVEGRRLLPHPSGVFTASPS
ncbi:class I SAM-dependent methyltransferase [Archangium violaceum]|uniref:methyltransferase domain-containing protein n=1 Tax=Archangium violaceum TaxID=83451 RepID=UPI002B2A8BF7|nr:class I SAM-dependent methyltransferase [Archangium violaceum]